MNAWIGAVLVIAAAAISELIPGDKKASATGISEDRLPPSPGPAKE